MAFRTRVRLGSAMAACLVAGAFAPSAARAADMPFAASYGGYSGAIEEERVTFGSGWYLRGDAAVANDVKVNIGNVSLPSSGAFFNSWSVGVGAGYKYNGWFRTDVTLDWRSPRAFQGNTAYGVACKIGAMPVYYIDPVTGAPTTTIIGSRAVNSSCSDYVNTRLTDAHVLFNAYADLGTWGGLTPYIGAGAGFNYIYQKSTRNWFMGNSVAYNPTWTDPYTGGTYNAYWDQTRSTKSIQFAWALMGGASFALTRNVAVDLGYRFLHLGSITSLGALTGTTTKVLKAQEVRLGLRYTID